MRIFLKKISFYALLLIATYAMLLGIVAYSTNYSRSLESYLFGNNEIWGSTYQRSLDFEKWLGNPDKHQKMGLIIGSSTVYRNVDPFIFDTATDLNWFNVGSSCQCVKTSFELLKKAERTTHLSVVFLDLCPGLVTNNGYEGVTDWVINSSLSFTEEVGFLMSTEIDMKLINQFLYRTIKRHIKSKEHFLPAPTNGTYRGKGFVCSDVSAPLKNANGLPGNKFNMDIASIVGDIAAFCKQSNIRLIVNVAPGINTENETPVTPEGYVLINNDDFIKNDSLSYRHFYDKYHMTCDGSQAYSRSIVAKLSAQIK